MSPEVVDASISRDPISLHSRGRRRIAPAWDPELPAATRDLLSWGGGADRVLREIGRGGMVVYEAERDDGSAGAASQYKILRAGEDVGLRQRVVAERQILAALDHPNISRLLDGGVTADGRPYLVMEHVEACVSTCSATAWG